MYRRVLVRFSADFRKVTVSFKGPVPPEPVSPKPKSPPHKPEITKGIFERFRRLVVLPSKDNVYYATLMNQYLRYQHDTPMYNNSVTIASEPKSMYLPEELSLAPDTFSTVLANNNFFVSVTERYKKVLEDGTVKNRKRVIQEHQRVFVYAYTKIGKERLRLSPEELARAEQYSKESPMTDLMYPIFTVSVIGVSVWRTNEDAIILKVTTTDNVTEINLYTATQTHAEVNRACPGDLMTVFNYLFLHNPGSPPKIFVTSLRVFNDK